MTNNRYTKNRNLWRKVVGYGEAKPRPIIQSFVDAQTSITYSLNLEETFRHRDYFQVIKPFIEIIVSGSSGSIGLTGEYDEGVVSYAMNDSVYKTINFNFTFSSSPYVVLSIEDDENNDTNNVNPYGISFSTSGANIGVSAPFSGTVRYRAIYASSYPAYITSSFTASVITASAGTVTVPADASYYATTYATLPAIPSEKYQTAWDATSNTSNILISGTYASTSELSSSLSAPYSKDIHFILIV